MVPLYAAPYDTGMGLVIVCSGIPVYIIGVMWKKKPKAFTDLVGKFLDLYFQEFVGVMCCGSKISSKYISCVAVSQEI